MILKCEERKQGGAQGGMAQRRSKTTLKREVSGAHTHGHRRTLSLLVG